MILARRVALNDVWLDEIDDRIVICGIEPADGRENISAVDTAAGFGQRVTTNKRVSLDVIIKFKLLQRSRGQSQLQERSRLLEAVNAWAAPGGVLTVNYKPNRRLNVILAQAPGEGSLWDYTKEFQMVFRAYAIPFWEEENRHEFQFGGTGTSGTIGAVIEGSAPTQCNVRIDNTSGAKIDTMTVTIGGNTMSFSGLGMAAGESLFITHNADGLVMIRIRNNVLAYRSAMSKRTGANDFLVNPGGCTFSYNSQRACSMLVYWRNRFL